MIERQTVEKWLKADDRTYSQGDVDELGGDAPEDVQWFLDVRYPEEQAGVFLFGRGDEGEYVQIQAGWEIESELNAKLRDLSAEEFSDLYFQLVRDLLRSSVNYQLDVHLKDQDFRGVGILTRVWEEEISRASLYRAMEDVADHMRLVIAHVRHQTGELL